jgi:hypothetical protein
MATDSKSHNSGASITRFAPGDFIHNARVAAAVVPAMAVMVGFGGTAVWQAYGRSLLSSRTCSFRGATADMCFDAT